MLSLLVKEKKWKIRKIKLKIMDPDDQFIHIPIMEFGWGWTLLEVKIFLFGYHRFKW